MGDAMKKKIPIIILFLVGLGILLYPTISNEINKYLHSNSIVTYEDSVTEMTDSEKAEQKKKAEEYNEGLRLNGLSDDQQYKDVLSVEGFMGYIDIPKINVFLPIYHGSDDYVLHNGVGHLEDTSLPIGGEGTHCVLTGHTGLPESMLFTDIDKLVEGDIFYIHVLDEVHAYKVDQIKVVEPYEVDDLTIVDGEDYLTLVTCTPYGINSHRLLVRGTRLPYNGSTTDNLTKEEKEQVEKFQPRTAHDNSKELFTKLIIYAVIAILLIVVIIVLIAVISRKLSRRKQNAAKRYKEE